MLRISDIQNNSVNWENVPFCEINETDFETYKLNDNDILFARTGGTVGKSYLVKNCPNNSVFAGYLIRTVYSKELNPQYLKLFMECPLYWSQLKEGTIATAQPNCNGQTLGKMRIPIPPKDEQDRIVCQYLKLTPLLDKYNSKESELDRLNDSIKGNLKKSILQYAIEGKLVEQDPDDESVSVLLDRIHDEKEKLINEGKIKRNKNESIIFRRDNSYYEKFDNGNEVCIDELLSFDIPNEWQFVRINDYVRLVTDYVASGSFGALRENVKVYKENNYALMVKTRDFSNNFTYDLTYTDKHGYEFLKNSNLFGGELILSNVGSIGKVFIVPNLDRKMTLAPNAIMIRLFSLDHQAWLYYLFQSNFGYNSLINISSATAIKKYNKTDFRRLIIPIPPLKEQQRIVKKLNKINSILD